MFSSLHRITQITTNGNMGRSTGGEQRRGQEIEWIWHLVTMTTMVFYKYHRVTWLLLTVLECALRREWEREKGGRTMIVQSGMHTENQRPSCQLWRVLSFPAVIGEMWLRTTVRVWFKRSQSCDTNQNFKLSGFLC